MYRIFLMAALALGLAACSGPELEERPDPIGDFRLGFLVPVASANLTKGPVSREATPEEWKAAVEAAFKPRFARYEGSKFYHLGVIVEGYVLAQPGVPVVLAPKSALIFSVTVIDDATEETLTTEPEQFTVLEDFSAVSVVGSGLVLSKEQQMANLAENAAERVERWLRDQPWFYDEEPPAEALPEEETTEAQ